MLAQDLHEHRREPVDRIRLHAFGVRQGRQRKEGPVDIGAAVNQIKRGAGRLLGTRHSGKLVLSNED